MIYVEGRIKMLKQMFPDIDDTLLTVIAYKAGVDHEKTNEFIRKVKEIIYANNNR